MGGWLTIGKYSMRLNLGRLYRQRRIFIPILAVVYLVFAAGFKVFLDANPDNVIVEFLSNEVLFATLMDLLLLYLFVYLVIIHVFTGIRKQDKSSIELLLSTPISSQDIVLGETVAMLPTYLIILPFVLIPLALIGYVSAGVGIVGVLLIILSQMLLFVVAIGIGAIILALIQSSIQRMKANKYFRLLASLLGAGIYISIYSLNSWLDTASSITQNPVFSYLPTSLSSNIIYSQVLGVGVSPSLMESFALLLVWVVVIYRVGIRFAGRAYSLERELSHGHVEIKGENILLRAVRHVLPGSQREKVITHFKLFFRDSYNFSTNIYIMIIAYFIPAFIVWNSQNDAEALLPLYTIEMLIIPVFVSIMLLSMFYLSRDALWLWKKAPNGIDNFLKSKWIQTYMLSFVFLPVPLVAGFIVGTDKIPVSLMLSTMVWLLLVNAFAVSYGIFINTMNPSMTIRGGKATMNSLVTTFSLLLIIIGTALLLAFTNIFPEDFNIWRHLLVGIALGGALNGLGFFLLSIARQKIKTILD